MTASAPAAPGATAPTPTPTSDAGTAGPSAGGAKKRVGIYAVLTIAAVCAGASVSHVAHARWDGRNAMLSQKYGVQIEKVDDHVWRVDGLLREGTLTVGDALLVGGSELPHR